jgi:predicted transcriptional regulator
MKINEKKIREEAKRRDLSLTDFAHQIGIKRTLLYHYMKNGATFAVAERLGKALNIDPKDLLI